MIKKKKKQLKEYHLVQEYYIIKEKKSKLSRRERDYIENYVEEHNLVDKVNNYIESLIDKKLEIIEKSYEQAKSGESR